MQKNNFSSETFTSLMKIIDVKDLSVNEVLGLIERVTLYLDLKTVGFPTITEVPSLTKKGGIGFTIFQALLTSFIVLEFWSEDIENILYLHICSCKKYDTKKLEDLIKKEFSINKLCVKHVII